MYVSNYIALTCFGTSMTGTSNGVNIALLTLQHLSLSTCHWSVGTVVCSQGGQLGFLKLCHEIQHCYFTILYIYRRHGMLIAKIRGSELYKLYLKK